MIQPHHRPILLGFDRSIAFLMYLLQEQYFNYLPDPKREVITAVDQTGERVFEFRMPLPLPGMQQEDSLEAYAARIGKPAFPPDYLILLMQAGQSALGYFEAGELVYHKVIRKYMVRKKQGKAQVAHLKIKGKSRAGSRVRLAQTVAFFEEINTKLQDWEVSHTAERILYSCPVRMWPLLFEAKVAAPFDQRDSRLRKIPKDVGIPDFEELQEVNRFALSGAITVYKAFNLDFFGQRF